MIAYLRGAFICHSKSADVFSFINYNMLSAYQECRKILEKLHFETIRKLGKGSYGNVILASKFTTSANFYAVKCISLKKCVKDPHLKRYVQQQTKAMCAIDHPNVVRLENSFADSGWHFIVMQYCDLGNLMQYQMKNPLKVINFNQSLKILSQILRGTQAIHCRNIMHRDLKCENIFLRKNKQGGFICKIGDFGFAKFVEKTAKTACGTISFMAPEVMSNSPYSFQADIWSIGVIFYNMLFGQNPFKSINIQKQIYDKCSDGFQLSEFPTGAKPGKEEAFIADFFRRTFQINPKKRITLDQMIAHPIFTYGQGQNSSDSTVDDQTQQQIQWQLQRIDFILDTFKMLKAENILDDYLFYAFKFYIFKIVRIFFHNECIKKFILEQPTNKLSIEINERKKAYLCDIQSAMNSLQLYKNEIKTIQRFKDGFNLEIQDFSSIKQGYRNTVGQVYEEVHRKINDPNQKTKLKFRVFCCHLINRVFKTGVKEEVFPNLNIWKKKKNLAIKKHIDFDCFEAWVKQESPEILLGEIQHINKLFYHKN